MTNIAPNRVFLKDRCGTSAVEFAIIAPVFLVMLLLMVGYGIYLSAAHSIQQLAADAARASIAGLGADERVLLASAYIEKNGSRYVFLEPDNLSVDVRDDPRDANQFRVDLKYDASNLPIWGIYGAHLLPGQVIERRSTIRLGGI